MQTHQLVITTVEQATQNTLLLMKKEIEKTVGTSVHTARLKCLNRGDGAANNYEQSEKAPLGSESHGASTRFSNTG